jgi:Ca2+-binding EF-hand superfamily protein
VPLTPFQRRKLARMFSVLDVDGDGFVERADYTRRVEALARLRGWSQESPEYVRNLQHALDEWESLRESADADDDGHVTREEFLRYGDIFLDDREAVRSYARGDVQLLFDSLDTDGDGKVSAEEYSAYLQVCGVDASAAAAFFAHADLNEDGQITRTEMAHAIEEFLLSENPEAGGNFLFGPLEAAGGE